MRTNIVIDDDLMAEAMAASGAGSKRETVDMALRTFLKLKRQADLKRLKGRVDWQGDLGAMRTDG